MGTILLRDITPGVSRLGRRTSVVDLRVSDGMMNNMGGAKIETGFPWVGSLFFFSLPNFDYYYVVLFCSKFMCARVKSIPLMVFFSSNLYSNSNSNSNSDGKL